MARSRSLLAALAVASALTSSCVLSERPPLRVLAIEAIDPGSALPSRVSWQVRVMSPTNEIVTGKGRAAMGATIRSLCHSLKTSFANQGCEMTFRDAEPGDEQLARSMSQIVELQEGWVLRSSRLDAEKVDGWLPVTATMRPR